MIDEKFLRNFVETNSTKRRINILKGLYIFNKDSKQTKVNLSPAFTGQNYTDGENIWLSFFEEEKNNEPSYIMPLLEAKLGHESAHINYTSFNAFKELQNEEGGEIAQVFNIVEDGRIENFISSKFKGLGRKLRLLNIFMFGDELVKDMEEGVIPRVMNNSLYYSKLGLYQEDYKNKNPEDFRVFKEKIVPLIDEAVVTKENKKFKEIVRKIWRIMLELFKEEMKDQDQEQGKGEGQGKGGEKGQSENLPSWDDLSEDEKEQIREQLKELLENGNFKDEPQSGNNGFDVEFNGEIDPSSSPRNSSSSSDSQNRDSIDSKDSKESQESKEFKDSQDSQKSKSSNSSNEKEQKKKSFEEGLKEELRKLLEENKDKNIKNVQKEIDNKEKQEEKKRKEKEEEKNKTLEQLEDIKEKVKKHIDYDVERYAREMEFKSIKYLTDSIAPKYRPVAKKLKNTVERIFKNKKSFNVDLQEQGILDISKLPLYQAGITNNVFKRVGSPINRSYAVTILLDNSGSMYTQEKYKFAGNGVSVLEEALKSIVPLRISGYTTTNRVILTNEFKDFDEVYSGSRLAGILNDSSGCDILADRGNLEDVNMLFEANMLRKRNETDKILIMVTDGLPNYGNNSVYVLKEVQKKIKKMGITLLPIFIGYENSIREIEDSFRVLYPENSFLTTPENLEKNISTILKRLFER